MKVIELDNEEIVKFDNGLELSSSHEPDCCEYNYLDFEQFTLGREFPTMTASEFVAAIKIKRDGFSITDSAGIPVWVQARSEQNGYYGNGVNLVVHDGSVTLIPRRPNQDEHDELFEGEEYEEDI